mmetsp:Transcript_36079/g.51041  ORF Transcript_36079/g.51041 Transcript_36079/m.51041 type:complete len:142 (-) Transcript_36079:1302-1727(-)
MKVAMVRATLLIATLVQSTFGFIPSIGIPSSSRIGLHLSSLTEELVTTDKSPSGDWELDCYSRPVLVDGKKLWEVLLTDSTGSFRYCKTLASNQVNSKELRKVVENLIDQSDTKPRMIRFFRGAMFNMVSSVDCLQLFARR